MFRQAHSIRAVLQVPSAYFLTDVFVGFDRQLGLKVFKPDRNKGEEGDQDESEVEEEDHEEDEGEVEEGGEENEEEVGPAVIEPDSDSCPAVAKALDSTDEPMSEADAESDTPMSDEVSNQPLADSKLLRAGTLELGEAPSEPSDSEDSMHRCSQVSSGWMGRAVAAGNKLDRERKEKEASEEAERFRKSKIDMMVDEICKDLEKEMDCELKGTELWMGYADWCRHAFEANGDHVYGHLATEESYQSFLRHRKSQDIRVTRGFALAGEHLFPKMPGQGI
eukprot:s92_g12.t1